MKRTWLMALLLPAMLKYSAVAAFSVQANFSGQLIEPPLCQINGEKPIMVEFGSVVISQINGDSYRKPVSWTLTCSNNPDKSMRVQISGTGSAFNSALLATSQRDLAIQILSGKNGENALALNNWLPFTLPALPVIQVVPVKKNAAVLTSGDFSAFAALVVEYQ